MSRMESHSSHEQPGGAWTYTNEALIAIERDRREEWEAGARPVRHIEAVMGAGN